LAEDLEETEEEEALGALPMIPIGLVVGRILVVSGLGFAAAFAIFFLVGGLWLLALVSLAMTVVFVVLMFAIERLAA
jgi:hypothetical protein